MKQTKEDLRKEMLDHFSDIKFSENESSTSDDDKFYHEDDNAKEVQQDK